MKYKMNPFTSKLDLITNDSSEILWYCEQDLNYYTVSIVIDSEVGLPTFSFTLYPVWRNWVDELSNVWIDELGNYLGETL